MALDKRKYEHKHTALMRDIRPMLTRVGDQLKTRNLSVTIYVMASASILFSDRVSGWPLALADVIVFFALLFFWWLTTRDRSIAFKLPMSAKFHDRNNEGPGRDGKAEGILYLGNTQHSGEEIWFTNGDARTHILYLGTTGSGKTVGLTSMVTNALTWSSGFVYVDGKADTDLWSNLSSLCRRFGRDDDLLILNYMTGNSDVKAPSNTMNPFSSGSASYLVNMLVDLMPDSEGDNAMWKERAVSLVSAMMPVLTWKRDNQDIPMSVRTIRDHLSLGNVVKLARDDIVPEELRAGMAGYLDTLPGFAHEAYDDNGQIKAPDGGGPPPDTTTANQQHGYLAMQFTRSLQSLGDDYGYIFDTQAADVDMVDIVLNRRILIVLIPALEKSSDEIANLGKIVASTMKGMMGSALGSTVEGEASKVIENKPTHSSTPFMTVFDEVGYYTASGMAVMAAQARSLGFCLVFSGQDLPAMKKRVREEANSITANCNIKIFGKLEDPTETKEFFEKTVGSSYVTEVSGYQMAGSGSMGSYIDTQQASVQVRARANYDNLRAFTEGQAIITFGESVLDCAIFYSNPGHAKAMRVTRFMALPPPDDNMIKHAGAITDLRDKMVNKSWTAEREDVAVDTAPEITALLDGFRVGESSGNKVDCGIAALIGVHALKEEIEELPPEPASADVQAPLSAKVPEKKENITPPPPSPIAEKPTAPKVEPTEEAESSAATSPMGFFGSGDTAKTEEGATPDVAPPPSPIDPVIETPKEAPKKILRKDLPPEIEGIISKAAHEARKEIFKETGKDGSNATD